MSQSVPNFGKKYGPFLWPGFSEALSFHFWTASRVLDLLHSRFNDTIMIGINANWLPFFELPLDFRLLLLEDLLVVFLSVVGATSSVTVAFRSVVLAVVARVVVVVCENT